MGSIPKIKKKNIPKSIHEMSQETLQQTLKKKRECNAKALEIVEKLCEPCIDEEWFLTNLQFINQCHFDDITVERAITKICGYPLCDQKLEKVSNQQYHISTRYNKVFDITERKNFCSSSCYKSAMHIKNQLFTSPLWFRDQEVIPKYTILKSMKSSMGEEVVFNPEKIKLELDMLREKNKNSFGEDNLDHFTDSLDKGIGELEKKCSTLEIGSNQNPGSIDKNEKELEQNKSPCGTQMGNKETNPAVIREKSVQSSKIPAEVLKDFKPDKVNVKAKNQVKEEPIDLVTKVEKCIFEWFSLDTFFYLYGEQKLKELLQDKAETAKQIINSKLSLAGHNEKINKIIQLYGLLDAGSFSSSEVKNLNPLPDYSILKEEGKTLEIKVRAFYQGQLQIKQPEKEEKKEEKEEESNAETEPTYLPLIDAHAQSALRKKIILDKLNRVLPELMKVFDSDYILQMNEVRNLVSTFLLSAHNITFKPTVWYLVGIILIKLLSLKDKKLESVLKLESSEKQILIILKNYELQKDYLDNLVLKLTDSVNLLEKLNEVNR